MPIKYPLLTRTRARYRLHPLPDGQLPVVEVLTDSDSDDNHRPRRFPPVEVITDSEDERLPPLRYPRGTVAEPDTDMDDSVVVAQTALSNDDVSPPPYSLAVAEANTPILRGSRSLNPLPRASALPPTPASPDAQVFTQNGIKYIIGPKPSPADLIPPEPRVRCNAFYVVTIGQKVGIYSSWNIVGPLVSGVPSGTQKKYKGWTQALAVYTEAFNEGCVEARILVEDEDTRTGELAALTARLTLN